MYEYRARVASIHDAGTFSAFSGTPARRRPSVLTTSPVTRWGVTTLARIAGFLTGLSY